MGRYERKLRTQARILLMEHQEEYLLVMLDGPVVMRRSVELVCQLAGWTYESYFLATMFLQDSLLEEAR